MTFMTWAAIIGVTMLGSAALAGLLAYLKNRDYSVWMGWGFVFPPILLVFLMMSKRAGPRPRQPTLDSLDREHT